MGARTLLLLIFVQDLSPGAVFFAVISIASVFSIPLFFGSTLWLTRGIREVTSICPLQFAQVPKVFSCLQQVSIELCF